MATADVADIAGVHGQRGVQRRHGRRLEDGELVRQDLAEGVIAVRDGDVARGRGLCLRNGTSGTEP